jgi:hypothetical protein
MYKFYSFLVLLILTASCYGDIDKDISTDLQFEGNEIFDISISLEESYFYALQPLGYYRSADSLSIPGCPKVSIDEEASKVTLDFSVNENCENSPFVERSGKIFLQYLALSPLESRVFIEYEDYTINGLKVKGLREFKDSASLQHPNLKIEIFKDLLIINEKNSSSRITGKFVHQIDLLQGQVIGFTSSGELEGRNVAGRRISMEPTLEKTYYAECILQGQVMPTQGSENWRVFRNENQATTHRLVYSFEEQCNSVATITLADGRLMVYRLNE